MSSEKISQQVPRGQKHVCDACDWVGNSGEAVLVEGNGLTFRCPDCDSDTHREYFGNPLPEEGTTLKTPNGLDECPVCGTPGIFVSEEPGSCMCGAELGGISAAEIVTVPERGEKDVILRASEDDLEHKVFDYWRVNGTPQKTGPGRAIMFSTTGETVDYYAPICTAKEGRIWLRCP